MKIYYGCLLVMFVKQKEILLLAAEDKFWIHKRYTAKNTICNI